MKLSFITLRSLARFGLVALLAAGLTVPLAADSSWTNASGGNFGDGANWDTTDAPGTTDAALFSLDETYIVTFDDDYTNERASVSDGVVTMDLVDYIYTVTSTDTSPSSLDVSGGNGGTALLTFLSTGTGAELATQRTRVGQNSGGTGHLTVTGVDWTAEGVTQVGANGGTGTLVVNGGSTVTFNTVVNIGLGSSTNGTMTISGNDTLVNYTTNLTFSVGGGGGGSGTLNLADGAELVFSNSAVTIGSGHPTQGSGEINITGGASMRGTRGVSVGMSGQIATINISGEGSEWDGIATLDWQMGGVRDDNAGSATVNITEGGALSLRSLFTNMGTSEVEIHVDGTDSRFNVSNFSFGNATSGASKATTDVLVSNGGEMTAINAVTIGVGSEAIATVEVNSGGSISAGGTLTVGSGTDSDGYLTVTGAGSTASTGNITVGNEGTGVMDILNGGVVTTTGTPTIGNQAGSTGSVTISGTNSQWTLSAGNGTVTVGNDGTGSLILADGGTLLGSATIGTTGTLSGDGIIGGLVTNSGLVSPGNSTGILYTLSGYTQTATGTLEIGIGGLTAGTGHDQISNFSTNFDATLAGTLNILSVNSFMPSLDDEFLILDFTAAGGSIFGEFDTINAFNLDSGLAWNFDNLYIDGTISVIPEPATVAFLLGALALGLAFWRRTRGGPRVMTDPAWRDKCS